MDFRETQHERVRQINDSFTYADESFCSNFLTLLWNEKYISYAVARTQHSWLSSDIFSDRKSFHRIIRWEVMLRWMDSRRENYKSENKWAYWNSFLLVSKSIDRISIWYLCVEIEMCVVRRCLSGIYLMWFLFVYLAQISIRFKPSYSLLPSISHFHFYSFLSFFMTVKRIDLSSHSLG